MSNHESGPTDHPETSPEAAQASKRRRIALACLDCRRRKLKCDRLFPACTRCQKSGHASSCIYDPDAVESIAVSASAEKPRTPGLHLNGQRDGENVGSAKNGASPSSFVHHHALDFDDSAIAGLKAHIYRLENRIIGLEKLTNDPEHRYGLFATAAPLRPSKIRALDQSSSEEKDLMMFRGKGFKTLFFGASHSTSYLSYLPDLRNFMKEMVVQHPGLAQAQKELKSAKVKTEHLQAVTKAGENLIQLLPFKALTDELIQLYVDYFETTYRVLHLPSFYEEYRRLWENPEKARPAFVALVLVMIATTSCLRAQGSSALRGDSSVDRETAIHWINAANSWLELQSQKHVTSITMQIHTVSFIAQRMNYIKKKRTWTAAGTLSRLAMSAGLHRDAEVVNLRHASLTNRRVSLFDQEMRRRIWTTVAELELQTSIERGMPAMFRDVIIDCGPPLNVDDNDINQGMDRFHQPRQISDFTRCSFLHLSQSSFWLRQELISFINGPISQIPYEEVLQYDRRIMQALDEIPPWRTDSAQLSRSLLQMQLQLLLLLLHRPYVRQDTESSRYDYSAMVHLRSAMSILDLHQTLVSARNLMLCLLRDDMLDAVLGICYNFSASNPGADHKLSHWNRTVGSNDTRQYLENGLSNVENKITRLGVGIQDYYCICAVLGLYDKMFGRSNSGPSHEVQAADRALRMLQEMLARQDNFSAAATLASLPNMPINAVNGMNGSGHAGNADMAATPATENTALIEDFGRDMANFDLTNMSGWDLEAFFNF